MTVRILQETSVALVHTADNALVISVVRNLAKEIGFDLTTQFLIASAVSELSTNIIRYAERGQIIIRMVEKQGIKGLEVVARDQGPGIDDIGQAMEEHYSTGNGLGLGLSSVKRIMDYFEIHSEKNRGTVIQAGKWRV